MTNMLLKQVVGIDVAQKELVVSLGRMDIRAAMEVMEVYANKTFANTKGGFMALVSWISKHTDQSCPLRFVMEATGVYHEALAYHLYDKNYPVSIVMPNKISNFFKTLEIKTVTDKSMSAAIAMFGLEKQLDNWTPPKKIYRGLRQLTRERSQLIAERTLIKNQLHAEQAEAFPGEDTISRMQKRIKMIDSQLKEILTEIRVTINEDMAIKSALDIITTIPGIGILTAAVVLAETNGFDLIRSKKQLTSYAGLDVKEKESGTSVKGKSKISKRGNKHLRKAMYMPALSAIRHADRYKAIYTRIVSRSGIKMKAAVAVQRKLLEMVYTIYKTNMPYNKNYLQVMAENS